MSQPDKELRRLLARANSLLVSYEILDQQVGAFLDSLVRRWHSSYGEVRRVYVAGDNVRERLTGAVDVLAKLEEAL